MQDLNISLIQFDISWEQKKENLEKLSELIKLIDRPTQLIVLPEMFTTGFTMRPQRFAEPMNGETQAWMKEKATETGAVICGSIIVEEAGNYYNRMIWMAPDGNFVTYDKRHLFSLAGEENHYAAGEKQVVTDLQEWRCSLQICYDLRFPVWCRSKKDFDVQFFIANWPDRRVNAWRNLLVARAIENQSYVVGVNRVGYDGNEVYHSGHSMVVSPEGDIVWTSADNEAVKTITLSSEKLSEFRDKFRFLDDMDKFEIRV